MKQSPPVRPNGDFIFLAESIYLACEYLAVSSSVQSTIIRQYLFASAVPLIIGSTVKASYDTPLNFWVAQNLSVTKFPSLFFIT